MKITIKMKLFRVLSSTMHNFFLDSFLRPYAIMRTIRLYKLPTTKKSDSAKLATSLPNLSSFFISLNRERLHGKKNPVKTQEIMNPFRLKMHVEILISLRVKFFFLGGGGRGESCFYSFYR